LEYLDVHYQILSVPLAALSKAWVWGRSFGGIIGFEFRLGWMPFFVECCVLSGEDLCVGLDRSSKGVLPNVVCLSLIVKP
jgi:hypothetical protein